MSGLELHHARCLTHEKNGTSAVLLAAVGEIVWLLGCDRHLLPWCRDRADMILISQNMAPFASFARVILRVIKAALNYST